MNKKLLIGILFVFSLFLFSFLYDSSKTKPIVLDEQYWKGQVLLKLAPSAPMRTPGDFDKTTGVYLTDGKNSYELYQSLGIKSGDFGKTFLVKIS